MITPWFFTTIDNLNYDVDIEKEVRKISQAEPFIAVTGKAGTEAAQYTLFSARIQFY